MAGSLSHIVGDDGKFTMDLIDHVGDAHEALEECFVDSNKVSAACRKYDFLDPWRGSQGGDQNAPMRIDNDAKAIPVSNVILQPLPHQGAVYGLTEDVLFPGDARVESLHDCPFFEVPKGFTTDGASIPRLAWVTTGTPFDPRHIRAAVLHDYLYQNGLVSRKRADEIFRSLLRADGVSSYQAFKMYWALRAFGWIAWRRYRQGGSR